MKKKTYQIIRKVIEIYYCDAETKQEAIRIVGQYGNPNSVTIVNQKIKLVR